MPDPDMTALDDLATTPFHQADAPLRARMLSRLADTELVVALTREPVADRIELRLFPLEGTQVALACDAEDRLAGFFGAPVAYAGLPGRVLAGLLKSEGAGLLVNPGHPSEMLLDAAMLDWLTGALAAAPEQAEARLRLTAPAPATVAALAEPLGARLTDLRGLIAGAALAGVAEGGHVLLVAGADPDRQPAIAKALAEALAFLPPQPGGVDISFSDATPPANALRFDLTIPEAPAAPPRPKGPPILR
ncbi:MAG: SseB family protein [Paracoccus sp. (in: a-proteobacteria)]|uniref:SseB family protein n=1 Tax=Paracoccus sp. TaxID=267 RepID=UPI00391AF6BC